MKGLLVLFRVTHGAWFCQSQEKALMIGDKDFAVIVAEHGHVNWDEVSRAESD